MSTKGMARSGAEGNMRLLKDYGGGSAPPRQEYPKGYAAGGHVKTEERAMGGPASSADGMPSRPSLARPGRKMGKSKGKMGKKGGTNVNVVIMPKGDPAGAPGAPVMDKPMPPPAMMPPPPPPPMPPSGAGPGGPGQGGGPPMGLPMRKAGGKVGMFKRGGHVKRADGGTVESEREAMENAARSAGNRLGSTRKIPEGNFSAFSSRNDDAAKAAYRSDIFGRVPKYQSPIEKDDFVGMKEGGPAMKGMDAGAGGAKGRLEKIEMVKREK